jgi:predicted enzyme related to lactoylglutathione lyase
VGRVTHYSRLSVVVLDVPAADTAKEVAFWQAATGGEITHYTRYPEYYGGGVTETLGLLVQELGDGPARVHVDIHTDDLDAEVARLEALGAERVGAAGHWVILRDPAGLPFCVVPEPAESFDRTGAQRWD